MKSFALLGSAVSLASAMCGHGTTLSPRSDIIAAPSFGYTGSIGPLGWHGIASGNMECAIGQQQSPIDILPGTVSSVSGTTLNLQLQNYAHGAELENLGTTLEAFVNGTMVLNNKVHSLRQFHFHTPSEHRIDGEYYPMEVHFVFESAGELDMAHPCLKYMLIVPIQITTLLSLAS
jgi:carbonic anhydrase